MLAASKCTVAAVSLLALKAVLFADNLPPDTQVKAQPLWWGNNGLLITAFFVFSEKTIN